MSPEILEQHESDIEAEQSNRIETLFEAFQVLMTEFDGRVEAHEMADGFLTVGLDMIHHMLQHVHPSASAEDLSKHARAHVDRMFTALEEGPWK
tara:strand:- start:740 stop:1021 length:282 start_codon:yes stop_codon:yes gene_type:complete